MLVEILDETGRFRRRKALRRVLQSVAADLGITEREMTLVLVDDETIARMNIAHRGVEGPTDVLSYPLHEPDDQGFPSLPMLGDVFISLDTARRQAREGGRPMWHEVAELAAHGMLHLLGFDHQDEEGWGPFRTAQARAAEVARSEDEGLASAPGRAPA